MWDITLNSHKVYGSFHHFSWLFIQSSSSYKSLKSLTMSCDKLVMYVNLIRHIKEYFFKTINK